eukprot:1192135-Prorocentrum_minimum.AAC.2
MPKGDHTLLCVVFKAHDAHAAAACGFMRVTLRLRYCGCRLAASEITGRGFRPFVEMCERVLGSSTPSLGQGTWAGFGNRKRSSLMAAPRVYFLLAWREHLANDCPT